MSEDSKEDKESRQKQEKVNLFKQLVERGHTKTETEERIHDVLEKTNKALSEIPEVSESGKRVTLKTILQEQNEALQELDEYMKDILPEDEKPESENSQKFWELEETVESIKEEMSKTNSLAEQEKLTRQLYDLSAKRNELFHKHLDEQEDELKEDIEATSKEIDELSGKKISKSGKGAVLNQLLLKQEENYDKLNNFMSDRLSTNLDPQEEGPDYQKYVDLNSSIRMLDQEMQATGSLEDKAKLSAMKKDLLNKKNEALNNYMSKTPEQRKKEAEGANKKKKNQEREYAQVKNKEDIKEEEKEIKKMTEAAEIESKRIGKIFKNYEEGDEKLKPRRLVLLREALGEQRDRLDKINEKMDARVPVGSDERDEALEEYKSLSKSIENMEEENKKTEDWGDKVKLTEQSRKLTKEKRYWWRQLREEKKKEEPEVQKVESPEEVSEIQTKAVEESVPENTTEETLKTTEETQPPKAEKTEVAKDTTEEKPEEIDTDIPQDAKEEEKDKDPKERTIFEKSEKIEKMHYNGQKTEAITFKKETYFADPKNGVWHKRNGQCELIGRYTNKKDITKIISTHYRKAFPAQ